MVVIEGAGSIAVSTTELNAEGSGLFVVVNVVEAELDETSIRRDEDSPLPIASRSSIAISLSSIARNFAADSSSSADSPVPLAMPALVARLRYLSLSALGSLSQFASTSAWRIAAGSISKSITSESDALRKE